MKSGFIYINNHVFDSLFAITPEEQEKGLMFQEDPSNMSFVYLYPKNNKFWMKNTPCSLDILFCNNNKITQIYKGEPYSTKIIGDDSLSDLIVEFPYGIVNSYNIKINDNVGIIHPNKLDLLEINYGI